MNNKKTGSIQSNAIGDGIHKPVPIELIEVSDKKIVFNSHREASAFLGLDSGMVTVYVRNKTKIIKGKDGKTYLIKRVPRDRK